MIYEYNYYYGCPELFIKWIFLIIFPFWSSLWFSKSDTLGFILNARLGLYDYI